MKVLLWVLFLFVVAGVIFVFGWVQILLPPGTYSVFFSKTSGYEEELMEPGQFIWRWQRLIPTNVTLFSFEQAPRTTQMTTRGELPSADLYAQSIGQPSSRFAYELGLTISARLPPASLRHLVANVGLRPEGLDEWYGRQTLGLTRLASEAVLANQALAISPGELNAVVRQALADGSSDLEIVAVEVEVRSLPDVELYGAARTQYLAVLEAQHQARLQAVTAAAAQREAQMQIAEDKLQILGMYGELLVQYPVLLEYLKLGQTGSFGGLGLPGIGPTVIPAP